MSGTGYIAEIVRIKRSKNSVTTVHLCTLARAHAERGRVDLSVTPSRQTVELGCVSEMESRRS